MRKDNKNKRVFEIANIVSRASIRLVEVKSQERRRRYVAGFVLFFVNNKKFIIYVASRRELRSRIKEKLQAIAR